MDYERTEEEQIAALKNWWKENGNTLIIGVALALAVIFGWQGWQKSQLNKKNEASALYQQVLEAAAGQEADADKEKSAATISLLGEKLKSEYTDTEYAKYAAFFLAKTAVEGNDLEKAEKELRWVLAANPDVATKAVANSRLARVLAAQGELSEALDIVNSSVDKTFKPLYLEIVGDIQLQQGNRDAAKKAYEEAKSLLDESERQRVLLEMKLSDLADIEGV